MQCDPQAWTNMKQVADIIDCDKLVYVGTSLMQQDTPCMKKYTKFIFK